MRDWNDHIQKYLRGELSPAEMHELEKQSLTDPFLADALEGVASLSPHELSDDLAALQQRVSRSKQQTWVLRVAAGLLILVGIGTAVILLTRRTDDMQLANEQSEPAKESVAARDSVADDAPEPDDSKTEGLLSLNRHETKREREKKEAAGPVAEEPTVAPNLREALTAAEDKPDSSTAGDQLISEVRDEITSEEDSVAAGIETQAPARTEAGLPVPAGRLRAADDTKGRVIAGKVVADDDGTPLPGVTVQVKGTGSGTVTDINGEYSIEISSQSPPLIFSFIGMQTSELQPTGGAGVDVRMKEDVSQLSEVIVTGFKQTRFDPDHPVIKLAEPIGGRPAYNRYLEDSLRFPQQALQQKVKGRVVIQFTVYTNGALSDFKVLKSLGYGCDDEVVRLVKSGPGWLPTTENAVPVESNVRVRMKFDPSKAAK